MITRSGTGFVTVGALFVVDGNECPSYMLGLPCFIWAWGFYPGKPGGYGLNVYTGDLFGVLPGQARGLRMFVLFLRIYQAVFFQHFEYFATGAGQLADFAE